jgi:hypothetical protein
MQPDIRFSSFLFNLQAEEEILLPPYKGSTFRGGFGHAFKKVVCAVRDKDCDECLLKGRCIYSYIFETPPHEGTEILRKYDKAPHPFVIEPPPETKGVYKQGDRLAFNLILIGRAIDYLPYFIYTFEELGRIGIGKGKGRYGLMDVYCDGKTIYNSSDRQLKTIPSNNSALSPLKLRGDERGVTHNSKLITLNFVTPTRIIVNGDLVVDLEFHHLIRSLLRRISTLSYFHDGKRLELDFKGMIQRAQDVTVKERDTRWYDWERYSARQETRMKMGGILGSVTFSGDLSEFMPYLLLGGHLHVGKGTSFGLGKYEVVSR